MKKREEGFLGADKIDHDGEIFDYIRELHEYLWKFIEIINPKGGGQLDTELDESLDMARLMIQDKNSVVHRVTEYKTKHKELMERWLDVYVGGEG